MKNEAISKINKFGRIGNGVALVGKILVGICMAFLLVAAVIGFVLPKDFLNVKLSTNVEMDVNMDSVGMDFTDEELEAKQNELLDATKENKEDYIVTDVQVAGYSVAITEKTEDVNLTIHSMAWLLLLLVGGLIMIMVVLCFASSLCKAFRDCETPFEDKVIKKMQNLAFSLIPWVFISSVTDSVINSLTSNVVAISFGIDFGVVLVILIVFALVYIFKYGAVLQQESDETL